MIEPIFLGKYSAIQNHGVEIGRAASNDINMSRRGG